ncbi:MAG TPA: aminotransferase class V-fold PLP-dependent enzyme [Thermoanaerobaculia bacterium]|nr:aminotransferase class V-fold PLP-dependent enzyme [Thermoanaerobaculia bacterium]
MTKYKSLWQLDPNVTFLNHGSFGACPIEVLDKQTELRTRLELEPVRFMVRELEGLLDEARASLAAFVGCDQADLAFVPNATYAINSVLRSMKLRAGDELIVTNHEYNASKNAMDYVAEAAGAKTVVVDIPFPLHSSDEVLDRLLTAVTPRTRLLLVDHVTSPTALVFPLQRIVRELATRGIETLVDGAHAPGMLPLELSTLGAAWYTGNLHKWVCAPKGAGFLFVRSDLQPTVRPAAISHGANSSRSDRSRFLLEFDWTGTFDPTPWLSVPTALRFFEGLPGGWDGVMKSNRELALQGRDLLCRALQCDPPAPDEMIGSMAAMILPDGRAATAPSLYGDPLQDDLLSEFNIEVPIVPWPGPPHRLLRISAQLYNDVSDYEKLAEALKELLAREQRG